MSSHTDPRLRELPLRESIAVSGGDCVLQHDLGRLAGTAARYVVLATRALVSFGQGLADGLAGK